METAKVLLANGAIGKRRGQTTTSLQINSPAIPFVPLLTPSDSLRPEIRIPFNYPSVSRITVWNISARLVGGEPTAGIF